MAVSAAMFEMTSDCMSLGSNLNCSHQLNFPMGLPRQLTGFPMVDASVRPASPPFWPWQSVSEVYQLSKVITNILRDRCVQYQDLDRPCMLIRDIYCALEDMFDTFAPGYTVVLACLQRFCDRYTEVAPLFWGLTWACEYSAAQWAEWCYVAPDWPGARVRGIYRSWGTATVDDDDDYDDDDAR